ncbi:MAG: hypothetical protein LBG10_04730 [Treponema sp.]|jgi:hypothetical protein|nr:hypothetical protein [Treponema sp.]
MFGAIMVFLVMGFSGCPMDSPSSKVSSEEIAKILEKGDDYLLNEDYDAAITAYKEAYAKDKSNTGAVIYSVLAELAAISIDPNVKNLMQNRLGVKSYPGTMGALFSDSWMKNYTDEELIYDYRDTNVNNWVWWWDDGPEGAGYYYWDGSQSKYVLVNSTPRYDYDDNIVPELQVPGWFGSTGIYLESKIGTVESYTTWTLLLAANLLDKNTSGLNGLFNDVLNSVFGTTFEGLYSRAQQLKDGDSITLDEQLAEKLGLDEIFEGNVIISKTELDVLLAGLRIVKASLEWLASYNWETDFSFLKFDWNDYNKFQENLAKANVSNFPFRNNFLKNQDAGLLNKSKADYLTSIDTLIGAYDAIKNKGYIPDAARDEWNNYLWIKDGLQKLKTAINAAGTAAQFWIPETMPSGNTWPNTGTGAVFGIDMKKFFTPDYLTLSKLVENNGNKPKFYGLTYTNNDDYSSTDYNKANIETYDAVGLKITLTPIKGLILKVFDEVENPMLPMPKEAGKVLYDLYQK